MSRPLFLIVNPFYLEIIIIKYKFTQKCEPQTKTSKIFSELIILPLLSSVISTYLSQSNSHSSQAYKSSFSHVRVETQGKVGAQDLDQLLDLGVVGNGNTLTSKPRVT